MRNTVRSIQWKAQRNSRSLPAGRALLSAIARRRVIGIVLLPMATAAMNACASVPLVAGAEPEKPAANAMKKRPPRCEGYILLVENQMSRPVEIYEVGLNSERLVTVALHGITEVQMVDHSQQFVAVSQGEVMAASNGRRAGDRVELQKNCRGFF